ncbi:MAG: sel1 repeat family protein [Deltaproteobacteria bacterium]|nr:sel1 repeat family protein [Deltaproteobacteria bacterium]
MTPIVRMMLLLAFLFTIPAPVLAMDLTGTVVSVNGMDVTIKVRLIEPFSPGVGDRVDLIESADGGKAEFDIGDWRVTEVNGAVVKAEAVNALGVNPPKVNMKAVIHLSPGPVHAGAPPAVTPEKKKQAVARGKVTMLRGQDVTIQLDKGQPQAAVGDVVELSFKTAGVVIPVGTWRVSVLKGDGIVEAKPLAPEGEPNIDMDAKVFTDASRKKSKTDSKKKPDRSVASNIEGDERSPLETACLKGNANACNNLGAKYATGKGVALNHSRAAELYRKACDGGLAMGCSNLGHMYENGYGVNKNNRLAADYYRKGCDGGYAGGCTSLGFMYEKGHGVNRDNKAAAHYYQKGCDGGNAVGCTNLGYMYEKGYGVKQDNKLTVDYYQRGCDGGNARGCGNMGWMVYHGRGTTPDRARGKKLLEQACKMGHGWSCDKLKEIGK